MSDIPEAARILFVGRDLQARVRMGAVEALGREVDARSPDDLPDDLRGYGLVLLDLDDTGVAPAHAVRRGGFEGGIVGFFSHVNEELGREALAAGVEAYPRGRFWRELVQILTRER